MKKLINKFKRGFTIVELVVVIAVIAILAAVLIPTLSNVLNSAEESNDMVTVSNLNKIVAAYDTVGEITTVNDALDGVLENGYSVSALTPTSDGNVIVYDATSNRFALLASDYSEVVYKDSATTKEDAEDWQTSTTWVFAKTSDATLVDNVYTLTGSNSYILVGDGWNGASVKASYGVALYDYLGSTTLASVEIVNEDNAKQTVKAGGYSNNKSSVAKTTVANSTEVDTITVNVNTIYLSCKASVYEIMNYSETQMTAVVGCKLNEYGSTLVYEASDIGNGKIENHNSNISKNISINVDGSTVTDASTIFTDKTSTLTTTEISNATTTAKITVSTTSTAVTITIDGTEISVSVDSTTGIVTGIEGTSISPYTISTLADFETLRTLIDNDATAGVYFKLVNDIDLGYEWKPLGSVDYSVTESGSATVYADSDDTHIFSGIFDGNGYKITMNNSKKMNGGSDYALFAYVGPGAIIKNFTVEMNVDNDSYYSCGAIASIVSGDGVSSITIEDITVTGTITATAHAGGLVGWYSFGCTFKNCINRASITTSKGSSDKYSCIGGISAQASSVAYNCTYNNGTKELSGYDKSVSFIDCANYGTLTHKCTDTAYFSIIGNMTAQVANNASSGLTALDENGIGYSTLTFTNCICEGTIYGVKSSSMSSYYFEGYIYGSDTEEEGSYETTYDASTQTANPYKLLVGYIVPYTVVDGEVVNNSHNTYIFPNGVTIETNSEGE